MADSPKTDDTGKPAPGPGALPSDKNDPKGAPGSVEAAGIPDPTGTISNREDGSGTRQAEPTPEEYPASAKVTPPKEQGNSVGDTIAEPDAVQTIKDDAQADHEKAQADLHSTTSDLVQQRRDIDDKLA